MTTFTMLLSLYLSSQPGGCELINAVSVSCSSLHQPPLVGGFFSGHARLHVPVAETKTKTPMPHQLAAAVHQQMAEAQMAEAQMAEAQLAAAVHQQMAEAVHQQMAAVHLAWRPPASRFALQFACRP
jgi:hypothetical protein